MSDLTLEELQERAAMLTAERIELWATHQKLHDELEAIFKEARRLHFLPPILSDRPLPEAPPKPPDFFG